MIRNCCLTNQNQLTGAIALCSGRITSILVLWAVVSLSILVHVVVGKGLRLAVQHEALASSCGHGGLRRHLAHVVHLVARVVAGVLWGHHVVPLRHHRPRKVKNNNEISIVIRLRK